MIVKLCLALAGACAFAAWALHLFTKPARDGCHFCGQELEPTSATLTCTGCGAEHLLFSDRPVPQVSEEEYWRRMAEGGDG